MKIKVSEATPRQLDWMVAKCEGYEIVRMRGNEITFLDRTDDGALNEKQIGYSTDWAQGGPIIERENICLWSEGYDWEAKIQIGSGQWLAEWDEYPLIAAMRCYVASKMGDEVEIPEELK